jgi:hypothetical protein
MGEKYNKFLPFYLESRITSINKSFIVKMEVDPETDELEITSLQIGSLHKERMPVSNVTPVTESEYEISHTFGWMADPADFFDLEMLYLNKQNGVFLVFDKDGDWKEAGLAHPSLSWEKNFQEHEWMDFTASRQTDINGGMKFLDP